MSTDPGGAGKGGKYKKRGKKVSHTLTQDDIDFLKKNTRYDEQEIKEWYRFVTTFLWITVKGCGQQRGEIIAGKQSLGSNYFTPSY